LRAGPFSFWLLFGWYQLDLQCLEKKDCFALLAMTAGVTVAPPERTAPGYVLLLIAPALVVWPAHCSLIIAH
jgi:hypothetical protein